jgi:hypothetical protein
MRMLRAVARVSSHSRIRQFQIARIPSGLNILHRLKQPPEHRPATVVLRKSVFRRLTLKVSSIPKNSAAQLEIIVAILAAPFTPADIMT